MSKSTNSASAFCKICLCILLGLSGTFAFCQPADSSVLPRSLFDLFGTAEIPNLTITSDFDSIKANIRNKNYVNGTIEFEHGRKSRTTLEIKLRPRGKSRRMMCDFPPLKLKFDKQNLKAHGLETFNDYKLVTHCMSGEASGQAVIRREYLVYKLLNILTPNSFKAKLISITYKNTGSSFNKSKHLAIIIEDAECLAHRTKCQTLESKVINIDSLHSYQEKITSVFQYMIGNADWSYLMGRNMELLKQEQGLIIPVPYDFDYAGLVRAPYARANAALGQKTVLDRFYLGHVKSFEGLADIFNHFKSKKVELMQAVEDANGLSDEEITQMKEYLTSFFDIIENQERVEIEMFRQSK
jgi:hypothetical protein